MAKKKNSKSPKSGSKKDTENKRNTNQSAKKNKKSKGQNRKSQKNKKQEFPKEEPSQKKKETPKKEITSSTSSDSKKIRSILATDCGSTTTKAILIELQEDGYRLVVRGEAPTTVEAPFDDVTVGVLNAVEEVEELRGRPLLEDGKIIRPQQGDRGVDIYISTSSAGGGLQMVVTGVVKSMTAESAERAALGAGAIVMDTICANDERLPHQQIERIRQLRPDMILMAGGIDGGTITHVVELAELIAAADPKPRLGIGYKLPVVYAGNKEARKEIERVLKDQTDLFIVENVRPVLEVENLGPAREKIHELFMEHVMAQAPGYGKLKSWTDADIMPTPGAVGLIMQTIAKKENINVVGVDIGGATTDVFSVFDGVFNRTVSANLGMSYSISNVLTSSGVENVLRWVPFKIDEKDLRNRIKNKMIRPTTIPQILEELKLEQAIAREALRLAYEQHKEFATTLKGVQQDRDVGSAFEQTASGQTLIDPMKLGLVVGSGGVLSHAPRRSQAAMMLLDVFVPEGVTQLAVDSIFMMPHLGVLSTLHEEAALEVFHKDCLILLGSVIAPRGVLREGRPALRFAWESDGKKDEITLHFGELKRLPIPLDKEIFFEATPLSRRLDLGEGPGNKLKGKTKGGLCGVILDCRGRPFLLPKDDDLRRKKLEEWGKEMDLYPETKEVAKAT
ncbi:MAG: methylaspartate mutase [Planctomycetota bacterium]|nr:MAG: methylaspartate mutase [Planctomycetota bacterium]